MWDSKVVGSIKMNHWPQNIRLPSESVLACINDVMTALWCLKNKVMVTILVTRANPLGIKFCSYMAADHVNE